MTFQNIITFAATAALAAFLSGPVSAEMAGDPVKGEKFFKRCKACHQVGETASNKTGPQLNGIVCRAAGSAEGFNYSAPMTAKVEGGMGSWTMEELQEFIENPKKFLGGRSKMSLKVKKEKDRVNVLAYLAQFAPDGTMYADGAAPNGETCE